MQSKAALPLRLRGTTMLSAGIESPSPVRMMPQVELPSPSVLAGLTADDRLVLEKVVSRYAEYVPHPMFQSAMRRSSCSVGR